MGVRKAVIPAAGLGTRLYPLSKSQPKEMLPLVDKPTIQLAVEELIEAGLDDILFVVNQHKSSIADHFDAGANAAASEDSPERGDLLASPSVRLSYTRQPSPLGLGHAVLCGQQFAEDSHFVVSLPDCIITGDVSPSLLERMLAVHAEEDAFAVIAVQRVAPEDTDRYGIVAFEGPDDEQARRLTGIVEKPGPAEAPSNLAVCARYVFAPKVFEHLEAVEADDTGEIQLTDAIAVAIEDGMAVYGVPLQERERRLDVGDFESYTKSFIHCAFHHEELGPLFRQYASELLDELGNVSGAGKQES